LGWGFTVCKPTELVFRRFFFGEGLDGYRERLEYPRAFLYEPRGIEKVSVTYNKSSEWSRLGRAFIAINVMSLSSETEEGEFNIAKSWTIDSSEYFGDSECASVPG
jgi:hypothetical protein